MKHDYDTVIVGAGVAGLALARALATSGRRLRVLVLEPRTLARNPRRWVFPARRDHLLARFETERLSGFVALDANGAQFERALRDAVIAHVPAADVQSAALDAIAGRPDWRLEERVRVDRINHGAGRLETSLGALRAGAIIDTRPVQAGVPSGAWTQIVHPAWLPGAGSGRARISFTAAEPRDGGVELQQILDLPDGRWVEWVRYAPPGDAGRALSDRVSAVIAAHGGDHEQPRPTRAVFPLGPGPSMTGRALAAPAAAGGMRFGPGASALALTEWAGRQAMRLARRQALAPPREPWPSRLAARWIDAWFRQDPVRTADWLTRLLQASPPDAALRLIAGTPSVTDLIVARRARHG